MALGRVNGTEIYYELHGPEDAEVIVLSNGIMMSVASWAFQTAELAKHYRLLLYDCRGMWKSEHPAGPYSMEMHADDLAALLGHLEIEQAHIAGISYGSEISMVFSLKYPAKTKSLIVIDGVSQIDSLLKWQTMPWLIAAEKGDSELLFQTSVPMNFSEEWIAKNAAALDASAARFGELKLESFAELMKAFFALDITSRLPEISSPTLIVVGEQDVIKGYKYSKILADNIPGAEFAVVPGSGYALCLEKPGILNTLILGFVQKNA